MKKKHPQKLGDVMQSVLSERGYLTSCFEVDVMQKWHAIVGEKISAVTECSEVREGIIYIRVSSASWRQELSFLKKEIIEKIKEKTRCKTIKDIIFY